jgi:hypothetical protein
MNSHLSDEQWAAALEESGAANLDHLRECTDCREEMKLLAEVMGEARAEIRGATEQPDAFWRKQREGISARLAAGKFYPPWKRLVWVTAAFTLVLLATTLLSRNRAPSLPETARTDPDDALIWSVQQSIRSDLPRALRPAALLAQEIDRAAASRRNP